MKKIINFALYDFANSAFTTIVITFIFSTYFAKEIAPNPVLGQSYWGWTIGITGIIVAIIGPLLGSFADKKNYTEFFIKIFTIICISLTCLLWFSKPSEKYLLYTLLIVGLANIFYELSLIFYNSILKKISETKNLGKSSGFSFALGYLGGIIVLIICITIFIDNDTLPFGLSKENSENVRATSIVVALWYLIFAIPFLFNLKEINNNKIQKTANNTKKFKELIWDKGLNNIGKFLLARMLYADGLNAIIVMGGIFAVGVFNLEIKDLLVLSVLMNITAFIGAIIGGYANDRFSSKNVIIFSLIGLILSSSIILFLQSKIIFLIFASINGFFIGPVQSASRVFMTKSIDENNQASGFGLFALSGKLTSFIGPLLVSTITFISNSQKIGFSSAIALLLIGLIILLKVKKN
ncbi:MAG: MFS transporter [Pelagibacterales bacterium]|jgi:UMF1 family MFS transporter|nr:MFS transporter [Pelagibacterales bacterium]|tara:strand:+ start:1266 stop:2492 length:1227 start_codon:yes stop_codon:yes gene_type:complete